MKLMIFYQYLTQNEEIAEIPVAATVQRQWEPKFYQASGAFENIHTKLYDNPPNHLGGVHPHRKTDIGNFLLRLILIN